MTDTGVVSTTARQNPGGFWFDQTALKSAAMVFSSSFQTTQGGNPARYVDTNDSISIATPTSRSVALAVTEILGLG
jgi:hypothetical protein